MSDANTSPPSLTEADSSNEFINMDFTVSEVLNGINQLKLNKAPGIKCILNEFIIYAKDEIFEVLTTYFNLILSSGCIPDEWSIGIICPVFKKGSPSDPENYRGISVLSCLGKLFTLLLNNRIMNFVESCGSLGNEQAGFRHNYSTLDHIITLKTVIDIYLDQRKKALLCLYRLPQSL